MAHFIKHLSYNKYRLKTVRPKTPHVSRQNMTLWQNRIFLLKIPFWKTNLIFFFSIFSIWTKSHILLRLIGKTRKVFFKLKIKFSGPFSNCVGSLQYAIGKNVYLYWAFAMKKNWKMWYFRKYFTFVHEIYKTTL